MTLQHLHRLEWCDSTGRSLTTGSNHPARRGFHLTSLLCGSEGTLGLVTAAELALVPDPQEVATLLAIFPLLDEATAAVVQLLGTGLLPVAVEMVDQSMLQAVEQAFAFGFPTDVEAAMICEFAGGAEEVAEDSSRAVDLLLQAGAREVRRAADEAERLELWKCRKKAFGAVGRLAPGYVTMDVVVPLGELPGLVSQIQVIKRKHDVAIATAFHAGDGNLHPGVQYDDRDGDQTRRAHAAADEIIRDALARGGSCTGEHGVGLEKLHAVPWQIDAEFAGLQQKIKSLFDPDNLLNPGKMLPPPDSVFADRPPHSGKHPICLGEFDRQCPGHGGSGGHPGRGPGPGVLDSGGDPGNAGLARGWAAAERWVTWSISCCRDRDSWPAAAAAIFCWSSGPKRVTGAGSIAGPRYSRMLRVSI